MGITEGIIVAVEKLINFLINSFKGQINFITTIAPLLGKALYLMSPFVLIVWLCFLISIIAGFIVFVLVGLLLFFGFAYNKDRDKPTNISLGIIISFTIIDVVIIYLIIKHNLWIEHTDSGTFYHLQDIIPSWLHWNKPEAPGPYGP